MKFNVHSRGSIRRKMLFIMSVLGLLSTAIGMSIILIYLNVVLRRESAFIIEERIAAVVDRTQARHKSPSVEAPAEEWQTSPASEALPVSSRRSSLPGWLGSKGFTGLVQEDGAISIRSVAVENSSWTPVQFTIRDIPLDARFLRDTAKDARLKVVSVRTQSVRDYRAREGRLREIVANFVPGSTLPVPIIVTASDWSTGRQSDWVVCEVQLSYARTIWDLSHMGLHTASWVWPISILSLSLLALWLTGILLSLHLSNNIVAAVDALSTAARAIGAGDFSVYVTVHREEQLKGLAACFNDMLSKLRGLREQERMAAQLDSDLVLASEVQAFLTPTKPAELQGITAWSTSTPARRVSGDLHEVLPLSPRRVGLICADISGKGVSSALLMSHLQGLAHAYVRSPQGPPRPSVLAANLNCDLYERSQQHRFATFFYADFDLASNTLVYANAGHCLPILFDQGGARFLPESSYPLGLFSEATFEDFRVTLEPGSILVIYTDGVTEALNIEGEEFGEERLLSSVTEFAVLESATAIGEAIRERIVQWSTDVEQFDDATLLVFHLPESSTRL